jgi:hypothetical protein
MIKKKVTSGEPQKVGLISQTITCKIPNTGLIKKLKFKSTKC